MRHAPNRTGLEAALAEIDAAFEDDSPERALELTEALCRRFPKDLEVLRVRAAALASAGEVEDACEVFRRALALAPDDVETLHAASEVLVHDLADDHDAVEEALGLLERAVELARREGDEDRVVDLLLLASAALSSLGETRRALEAVDQARALAPQDPEVLTERGIALFELCRLEEAKDQLEAALGLEPALPWAHYYLGLVAEFAADDRTAERCLARARRLGPGEIPAAVELSRAEFEAAVEEAFERLPGKVHHYLANVAITVEELPALDELRASEPPLSPSSLGMFRGTPVTEQSNSDPWSQFPSAIMLFRRNLQRFARDREELVEQIGVTLVHEVGHFLGLDEEELYDRGLD
jgi:predicted Zn-dependent protease with MMP-like domain